MVVDTSALVAILLDEPERERVTAALLSASPCRMSAATLVEAGLVMQGRFGDPGAERLDRLIVQLGIEIVPLTAAQAALARGAFRRFGKGRHPAALNLGDCFSYALAVALDAPLLFVGDDFARTDIAAAA